jgi:hypothetical protein
MSIYVFAVDVEATTEILHVVVRKLVAEIGQG